MIKYIMSIGLLFGLLFAFDIPTQKVAPHSFGARVALNSKIIQLSNAKQSIMALLSGHIEHYYVKAGETVKLGDKIALIESIELSRMSADYIALKSQVQSIQNNYRAAKALYAKGMTSMQDLNNQNIQMNTLLAKLHTLESQLATLGIDTKNLKEATANYTLYAHSSGQVAEILQPLHTVVSERTPIVEIVKEQALYLKSYIPLEFAQKVKIGQKITFATQGLKLTTHISQLLPEVDETTQRIIVLSSIDKHKGKLFINAFVESWLYFDATRSYLAVQKSALSFFNNEWVVFVPKIEQEHGGHKEHEEAQEHGAQDEHDEHGEEHDEDGEEEHEHEHSEIPYEVRVVNIVAEDEDFVAVEGLREGEVYVSGKSYFVKSMLLKSSLGEHGH